MWRIPGCGVSAVNLRGFLLRSAGFFVLTAGFRFRIPASIAAGFWLRVTFIFNTETMNSCESAPTIPFACHFEQPASPEFLQNLLYRSFAAPRLAHKCGVPRMACSGPIIYCDGQHQQNYALAVTQEFVYICNALLKRRMALIFCLSHYRTSKLSALEADFDVSGLI